jgi:peptidoglycan/xylan/chitin deacetylase (PgdA/CDA1 family)
MGLIRKIYHSLLLVPAVPSCFHFARKNCATVFMMHRFTHMDCGISAFEPSLLREGLEYLRGNGYEFLSLADLLPRLSREGPPLNGAVVFTIDDGYIDHAEIASPIFAEFDCPVTTFVTTGFLDGKLWMWWNKIEFIFQKTALRTIESGIGGERVRYYRDGDEKFAVAQGDFTERCKLLDDVEKLTAIASLAESSGVGLPEMPPSMYAPMSWDQARQCEKRGMTFGPHTVTHPVLSRTTPEKAEWEITESWRRLCAEVRSPVPVFCYPNGQWSDFGAREINVLRKTGLSGAVVGAPGYAEPALFAQDDEPFKIRRLPYPDTISELIQYASGIERCKQMIRSRI